jgi:hypothetical protein
MAARIGVHLSLEVSGVQAVTELLEPVHPVLRDAAPVLTTFAFPAIQSFGLDLPQNDVPRVVVSPPNRAVSRWDGRPCVSPGDGLMAAADVVRAPSANIWATSPST